MKERGFAIDKDVQIHVKPSLTESPITGQQSVISDALEKEVPLRQTSLIGFPHVFDLPFEIELHPLQHAAMHQQSFSLVLNVIN